MAVAGSVKPCVLLERVPGQDKTWLIRKREQRVDYKIVKVLKDPSTMSAWVPAHEVAKLGQRGYTIKT